MLFMRLWRRSSASSSSRCYASHLIDTNFLPFSLFNCQQRIFGSQQPKFLCTKTKNGDNKPPSSVSKYEEQCKQLQNLDFMTATKILFDEAPQKKKFGLDFHLVQLFFACLPSLAVYLVAQYARHEMRKMDAQLEQKKKEEEEKTKEIEQIAAAEIKAEKDQLVDVKDRLEKLEEVVKEIAVATKKQPDPIINEEKKQPSTSHSGDIQSSSETTTSSVEKKKLSEKKSDELKPNLNNGKQNES